MQIYGTARGFTLLDLLAVIFLAALGAGLLLPALIRAGEASDSAGCMNNLRRIGQAEQMYARDFDGISPDRIRGTMALNVMRRSGHMPERPDDVYLCPEWEPYTDPGTGTWAAGNTTYGVLEMRYGSAELRDLPYVEREMYPREGRSPGVDYFTRLDEIRAPEKYLRYGDSLFSREDPRQSSVILFSDENNSFHLRHGGKSNVVFADGRAEAADGAEIAEFLRHSFLKGSTLIKDSGVHLWTEDVEPKVLEGGEGLIDLAGTGLF